MKKLPSFLLTSFLLVALFLVNGKLFAQVTIAASKSKLNSPLFSIDLVNIDDPNNVGDAQNGNLGTVDHLYQIGKYDITAAQYCTFLNAVAATDPHNLFNINMQTDTAIACITRSGEPGNYHYDTIPGREYFPITYVNYFSAIRFCNWMANGQPTGEENARTTEDGSYTILNGSPILKEGAKWRLPTEDEWYKAAYYVKGTSFSPPKWWIYPTGLTQPGNSEAEADNQKDSKNCNYQLNGNPTTKTPPFLTPVGAFKESPGPFGTYDMGGDVSQWTSGLANLPDGSIGVIVRGGSWCSQNATDLAYNAELNAVDPNVSKNTIGFRVVYIKPETPSLSGSWGKIEQMVKSDVKDCSDLPHHPEALYTIVNYHMGAGVGLTIEWLLTLSGKFIIALFKILFSMVKYIFGSLLKNCLPESVLSLFSSLTQPEAIIGTSDASIPLIEVSSPGVLAAEATATAEAAAATATITTELVTVVGPIVGATIISAAFAEAMYEANADPNMSPRMATGAAAYSIAGVVRLCGMGIMNAMSMLMP